MRRLAPGSALLICVVGGAVFWAVVAMWVWQ